LRIPKLELEYIDLQAVCGRAIRVPIRFLRSKSTRLAGGGAVGGVNIVVVSERIERELLQGVQ
jgi:hypothetical protein